MPQSFSGKKVLITGAAGFIGSHLSEYVIKNGGTVWGVDNFITGQRAHKDLLQSTYGEAFHFIEADVSEDLSSQFNGQAFDFVFHFASPASPPKYQANPEATYKVNSFGTHNLLNYIKKASPKGIFLFASTSEIYGDPKVHPQPETYWGNVNPNGIRSCYDESKRMGETICGVFDRDYGLDVRIVRIFNTYGPRIDLEDGRVIPSFITSVLKDHPFTLYGDGKQTRSYCYIDDLVEGIARMATTPNLKGRTVNLGNPGEYTISETIEVFKQVTGKNLEITTSPLPGDDPMQRQPDISLAKQLLDWEPQIDFPTGLKRTLESFGWKS